MINLKNKGIINFILVLVFLFCIMGFRNSAPGRGNKMVDTNYV
ncbi:hypothetical protein ALNOE001_02520 [Candidatus Methanobinarius endosymbioticus]|uniref:Uncharacterized protein n=1 Tax=Candidatus Methanobinarius endosymbioticus TaxID=2006182 RepID=A0A366MF76_9EURY|nr:hypothetical protein ALNOE001_02520 [Candidatus Methanobinarius endosymbioticus]